MDATKQMLDAVRKGKTKLTKEKNAFDNAMELVGIKTDSEIDLFAGNAVSRVADITLAVRKACDRLYAACQTQVALLDGECRPLLAYEPSTRAVKEVTALIQRLNTESEIGTNFRGNLNGGAFRDLLNIQYIPSIENKAIQAFWESKYSAMPGTAEEDKAYAQREAREHKSRADTLRQAKLAVMREEQEEKNRQEEAMAREREDRLARIAENAELTRQRREYLSRARQMLGGSGKAFAYVKADGTVRSIHSWQYPGAGVVTAFRGIRSVVCTNDAIVGLRCDGTCIATATASDCESCLQDVTGWRDIEALAAGEHHVVGLRTDGTCVATSFKKGSRLDVGQCAVETWRDIQAIACGDDFTVGLKKDGTLVYTGCEVWNREGRITRLTDIEMIAADQHSLVALTKDGKLRFAHTMASGSVSKAENVVQLAVVEGYPYALQADGTLLGGDNDPFRKDKQVVVDRNVLAMVGSCGSGNRLCYLREDGTVMAKKWFQNQREPVMEEKIFDSYEQYCTDADAAEKAHQERIRQILEYRKAGACQYCGGAFKQGLFGSKCTKCGKKKDY